MLEVLEGLVPIEVSEILMKSSDKTSDIISEMSDGVLGLGFEPTSKTSDKVLDKLSDKMSESLEVASEMIISTDSEEEDVVLAFLWGTPWAR